MPLFCQLSDGLDLQDPEMVRFSGVVLECSSKEMVCSNQSNSLKIKVDKVLYQGRTVNQTIEPKKIISVIISSKVNVESMDLLREGEIFTFLGKQNLCLDDSGYYLTILNWTNK